MSWQIHSALSLVLRLVACCRIWVYSRVCVFVCECVCVHVLEFFLYGTISLLVHISKD